MGAWGNMYFLKEDVTEHDIWECICKIFPECEICKTFPEFELPAVMPYHFSVERENYTVLWDCPKGDEGFAEFRFSSDREDGKRGVTIVFDKKRQEKDWGKNRGKRDVHALLFEETADSPDLLFCHPFFGLVKEKKLVPDIYFKSKIVDDAQDVQRQFIKGKDVSRPADPDFPVTVKFRADKDGNFFFPEGWIEKLKKDLWFINADMFVRCYGILGLVKNLKTAPGAQKRKVSQRMMGELCKCIAQEVKSDSMTRVETTGSNRIVEILPDLDNRENYEKLKNEILISVDHELLLRENRQKYMSEFLAKVRDEDFVIRQKAELLLKERGLDERQIAAAYAKLEGLKKEKADLKRQVDEQSQIIAAIETERSAPKPLAAVSAEQSVSMPAVGNTEAQTEIDKWENVVHRLQDRKKTLVNEIGALNDKRSALQKKYDEWKAMLIRKQNENSNGYIYLEIPCSEENLFLNEIEDYLYSLLYGMLEKENSPNNKGNKGNKGTRKRDVVDNLLEKKTFDCGKSESGEKIKLENENPPSDEENKIARKGDVVRNLLATRTFYWEKSESGRKLKRIKNMLYHIYSRKTVRLEELQQEGFELLAQNVHAKYCFYREKYMYPFPTTPSDKNSETSNMIHQLKRKLFLIPKK